MAEQAQPAQDISPIDQLLKTLGMTREDLDKRSRQMRQFLDNDPTRGGDAGASAPADDAQPCPRLSRTSSSQAPPVSRSNSTMGRDASPPATPVKAEPHEVTVPLSMEAVIERQNQSRREKKRKDRTGSRASMAHPPSPTPSASRATSVAASQSRGLSVQPQASRSMDNDKQNASLFTPAMSKYYREHTLVEPIKPLSRTMTAPASTSSAPSQAITSAKPSQTPSSGSFSQYSPATGYPRYLPLPYPTAGGSGTQPVTPHSNRTMPRDSMFSSTSFPPSSPPQESPQSSPSRGIVNLVSSPGPANTSAQESETEALPFTLPPGPYSPFKPERSYAAIIGQAILSSPEHRLTLQEIYDWITIVYAYFKRGETTWMNSIRHVLSTTVVFRKVTRDRAVGRSLWAIWDQDLECFEGGGFKKHKCKDANVKEGGRANRRKRANDDDEPTTTNRASKKARPAPDAPPSPVVVPTLHAQPLFPPTRPATHHQPYYSAVPQTEQPPGLIFPPLPVTSNYQRVALSAITAASTSSSSASLAASQNGSEPGDMDEEQDDTSPVEPPTMRRRPPRSTASISSLPSMPALTPNHSSSSPPSSMPPSSEADFSAAEDDSSSNKDHSSNDTVTISGVDVDMVSEREMGSNNGDFGLLGPAPLFTRSRSSSSALQPGIMLGMSPRPSSAGSSSSSTSSNRLPGKRLSLNDLIDIPEDPRPLPPIRSPSSPGFMRSQGSRAHVLRRSLSPGPPSTPPRQARKRDLHRTSSHSPLSQMSPATSLAHYKSHLDHPSAGQSSSSHMRGSPPGRQTTPPRRMVTPPRKPVTLATLWPHTSPYRTPTRGYPGISPFRTPNGRLVLDDYDTSALLDDEVRRSALRGMGDSPGGIFGKGRSHLLYNSPGGPDNLTSPKYSRWY